MKKTIFTLLLTTALSCALFTEAKADSISFTGTVTASNGDSSVTSPTTLTFLNPWTVSTLPAPTGIFAGTGGASTTMTNFTFTGDGAGAALSPAGQFVQWSFVSGGNSYSFTLQVLNNAAVRTFGSLTSIAASGTGFVTKNGVQYSGVWSLNGTSGTQFNFVTTSVPDGGSAIALMGVALTGIEGVRRVLRRRNK